MKKNNHLALKIIITVFVLILLFYSLITFITDYMWFKELGYVSVFFKKLFTQLKIGIPTFIIITFLAYLYLKTLKKIYFRKVISSEKTNTKRLNKISWLLAGVFGLFTTYVTVSKLWFQALQYSNSTSFKLSDPLFKNDISFYIFKLDFISGVNGILLGVLIVFIILTAIYYGVLVTMRTPDFWDTDEEPLESDENEQQGFRGKSGTIPNSGRFKEFADMFGSVGADFKKAMNNSRAQNARRPMTINKNNLWRLLDLAKFQIIIVGIVLFILIGISFFLKQYDLLSKHRGAVYGAGFTDVHITLWVYRIGILLSALAAVMFAIGVKKKKLKTMITIPIIMICVSIAGSGCAALVQNFVVSPDEISKEKQYLESNIKFTREAYALTDVNAESFSASKGLASEDIAKNSATINNIRINDYTPAEEFYNQTQSIRQYYQFNNVDVDRYMIDGELTQTFLSAREIDETRINEAWLTKHIKYTHGYGITLSRVDEITSSGQPRMIVDSIPPVSDALEVEISRPEIYFGELTNDYILVNTDEDEFDYPDGDSNKYAQYKGKSGIKMNLFNRILFSIREKSLKLLVSSNVDSHSKIVINRNIENRVKQIMPYLSYEEDPYMVTVNGKLYWIIDAYTASSNYPYSEPYDTSVSSVNYIRNSVKVVIDAYNGNTDYYIVDEDDPIAETYQKIYPALFKDLNEMPEDLRAHIRYPHKLFNIQATVYERYHMSDVKVFYQKEDVWAISNEMYGTEEQKMIPQYYVMSLPGNTETEFVSLLPYTPKDKKNMTGIMIARSDGKHYGELVLYKLPKSKVIYGPMQIEAQIDQNTEISKEFSLWNSNGSKYSRGNMFVIPIEDSLLYVEPIYLEATNSSIPEVKRVIVAYGDQIAYEPTLAEALNELFGEGSANEKRQESSEDKNKKKDKLTQGEIITKAQNAFDKAQQAQKNGDWAQYGEYIKKLEKYLSQLNGK